MNGDKREYVFCRTGFGAEAGFQRGGGGGSRSASIGVFVSDASKPAGEAFGAAAAGDSVCERGEPGERDHAASGVDGAEPPGGGRHGGGSSGGGNAAGGSTSVPGDGGYDYRRREGAWPRRRVACAEEGSDGGFTGAVGGWA